MPEMTPEKMIERLAAGKPIPAILLQIGRASCRERV